jgi:hypothetical protein
MSHDDSHDGYAESIALRLALAYDAGNDDALAATLNDFVWGCPACGTAPVVLALLSMLHAGINGSTHRDELITMIQERLVELLDDELGAEP